MRTLGSYHSLPGLLIFLALALALFGALFAPVFTVWLAALLALYTTGRFIITTLSYMRGLRRIQETEQTDWHALYDAHPGKKLAWEDVQHVVIIPNYNEPVGILRKTLDAITQSPEAGRITVVLAMEAAEPESTAKGAALKAEYTGRFADIVYTVHPANLPGEIRCKSANLAWAGRWVARQFTSYEHVVVTAMDADTLWHPQYFTALTYFFATDPARHRTFWQAPIRYHANINDVHPVFRNFSAYANATELGYLHADWWDSLPISSYSLSLRLLEESHFWDADVIADEWHMYIKAFFAQRGDLTLKPIYLPFLATVATGATFWQTFKNRYTQTLRHAWGSKEIGYALTGLHIPGAPHLFTVVAHDLLMSGAGWVFVTFGSQLPVLLNPPLLAYMVAGGWLTLPFVLFQFVGLTILILSAVCLILDIRTRAPHPTTPQERLLTLIGFLLLPIFLVIFVILPVIHAQLRLLFGKSLTFRVTAKA